MAAEPGQRVDNQALSRGERRLAAVAGLGAGALLLAACYLWLRYGESVYANRILSLLEACL